MVIGIDGSRAFVTEKTGTERYTWEMLRALARVGKKNKYRIYIKSSEKRKAKSEKPQLKTENYLSKDNSWPKTFQFIEVAWPRLWTQGGLAWRTWTDKLDVLWVPAHTLPVLGNPNLPMIVTIHGIEYEFLPNAYRWGQNFHLTWSTQWAVRRAQKIIAVSQKTKTDLIEKLGVDGQKVEVIHEGVDIKKYQKSRQRNGQAKIKYQIKETLKKYKVKEPYVLFVGTVQPRKNLVRLIEAFAKMELGIRNNELGIRQRYELVIVGKMGWNYEEILIAPKKFGVENRVKFLGFVPDEELPGLYCGASLYVEPSLQEGFGLPVLEAMAGGVPVVAAKAGALPEIVGVTGILVDPMSIEAIIIGMRLGLGFINIKNQIHSTSSGQVSNIKYDNQDRDLIKIHQGVWVPRALKSLSGERLRKELINRGSKRVRDFGWDTAAKKMVDVFGNLIKDKSHKY